MPAPVLVPPSVGVTQLASRYAIQVDVAYPATADWQTFFGIETLQPDVAFNDVDTSNYDSGGWDDFTTTSRAWSLTGTQQDNLYVLEGETEYTQDAVAAYLEERSDAREPVHVRWFNRNGVGRAYEGVAVVKWMPQGGTIKDVAKVNFELKGKGARNAIANPSAVAPTLATALPAGQSIGETITITGDRFVNPLTITIDGIAVVSSTVLDEYTIDAVIPTGAAGVGDIIVTNQWGASNALSYTVV